MTYDIVRHDLRCSIRHIRSWHTMSYTISSKPTMLSYDNVSFWTVLATCTYDVVYNVLYDIVGHDIRCHIRYHRNLRYRRLTYDIVGFEVRYRRFLDGSCQSYVRCDVRHRIRYRRFCTISYAVCMSRIGIMRCCTYNTMQYVHIA